MTAGIVRSVRAIAPAEAASPDVEVVVPVYNEQAALEQSIRRLHGFLVAEFPFSFGIVIADNASTDATTAIAGRLAEELPEVEVLRLERKGRGHALREAWSRSSARVVTYMDADLSTDLRALLPLVAPLLSGHSDVAIGTRLARGARVMRGPKREFISRAYNRVLRTVLRAGFTDAQCGFKAVSARALPGLLDEIRDDGWFFDTELLILAQRQGKRIHEVPVDWVDDPESSVELVKTAVDDLRGVGRLLAASHVTRFAAIGILSTFAHALIFLILSGFLAPELANALALAITAVGNTAANRRITFGVSGREGLLRHQLQGLGVFALALAMTSGALGLLHLLVEDPSQLVEVAVLIAANLCATITRYLALRRVFGARRRNRPATHSRLPAHHHGTFSERGDRDRMIKNQRTPLMYVVAGVAAVVLAFGAYALGNSNSDSGSNGTASASQPGAAGQAPRNGQAGPNGQVPGRDRQAPRFGAAVTSETAAKVKAAALSKYDGTIERIMKLGDGSYVAHVITSDGEVHVLVSKDFEVTGVAQGGPRHGGPRAPQSGSQQPSGTAS